MKYEVTVISHEQSQVTFPCGSYLNLYVSFMLKKVIVYLTERFTRKLFSHVNNKFIFNSIIKLCLHDCDYCIFKYECIHLNFLRHSDTFDCLDGYHHLSFIHWNILNKMSIYYSKLPVATMA